MRAAAHVLWRINNEYRKRLSQAQTLLNLLEQVLLMQRDSRQEHTLAALAYLREQVDIITEEHRRWRHHYYYESLDTKRMVQDTAAVDQALLRFNRMRAHQERRLQDMYVLMDGLPRPESNLTSIPNGDLWTMTQYAIEDLVTFDNFFNETHEAS